MTAPFLLAAALALGLAAAPVRAETPDTLLNVSYDISRELFTDINAAFAKLWQAKTGQAVTINQSHAGSSRQARAVLEGLPADVVTFNQITDVQILHDRGKLIPADWQSRLPHNSSPYYSLPAFLVRAGNPKGIKDWDDLIRDDVQVVFPNPKTSGNARYTYLAATAYALDRFKGDQDQATAFVKTLFSHVPVFDTGGRAATTTFVERQVGDVLITFEAEVNGIRREFGTDKFTVVIPSLSLLAEFPVTVVDSVVEKRNSRALATAYLEFLYTPDGQDILARHDNRVRDPEIARRYADRFPPVRLATVDEVFGGWTRVQKEHFGEGGVLERVFVTR